MLICLTMFAVAMLTCLSVFAGALLAAPPMFTDQFISYVVVMMVKCVLSSANLFPHSWSHHYSSIVYKQQIVKKSGEKS